MKTVVLFGSPHEKGNTAHLLENFLDSSGGGRSDFGEIIIFNFYKMNIKPCVDCGFCKKNAGLCSFDDLIEVLPHALEAEIVIIATPIYNFSFPAPLKAFVDRLQCIFDKSCLKNEDFSGRGILLCSCGSSGKLDYDLIKKQSELVFRMLNKKFEQSILLPETDNKS